MHFSRKTVPKQLIRVLQTLISQTLSFRKRKKSMNDDVFPFAFDILPFSSAIPEGPASTSNDRNERIPGAADRQVHCCRDVKRERGSILKRNILRF